jgi:hypothetical protein
MFWSLLLPLHYCFIVALVGGGITVAALVAVWYFRLRRPWLWGSCIVLGTFAITVITCLVVVVQVQKSRFVLRHVASPADPTLTEALPSSDELPTEATNLLILPQQGGLYARYTVSRAHLLDFMQTQWRYSSVTDPHKLAGELAPVKPDRADFREHFARFREVAAQSGNILPDELPADCEEFHGPDAANGAHTIVWFSAQDSTAWQFTSYW